MTSFLEEQYLTSWQERQTFAENMQPIIGQLFRNDGIEISIYGRTLVNASAIDIIKAHKSVALHEENKLRLRESFPFIKVLASMSLAPAHIDLGKLAYRYLFKGEANGLSIEQFLEKELATITKDTDVQESKDVVLYGFGRIGRLLARLLIERAGPNAKLKLRAIVIRPGKEDDLEKRASLLRRDSVHGAFNGSITIDKENNVIKANGAFIHPQKLITPLMVSTTL
jgi:glyceraldehyde 3-phosphate dehydrogenase